MRSPLRTSQPQQETGQRWTVQSSKMLQFWPGGTRRSAMVAYQDRFRDQRAWAVKKAVTGEGGNLHASPGERCSSPAARTNVFLLQLEGDATCR